MTDGKLQLEDVFCFAATSDVVQQQQKKKREQKNAVDSPGNMYIFGRLRANVNPF